ncbi:peptidoglycan DD-metalloendopeptidase family protein [Alcaligenaceae bacterium]|nr:peptidoglycan DD-metalloendopeptidase family protein [Alcaligenaceae bacterium]
MRYRFGAVIAVMWVGLACAAEPGLAERQAEARRQQTDLRTRIEALQKQIDSQESSRRDAANELRASESAISDINLRLAELAARERDIEAELKDIAAQTVQSKKQLAQRQHELADQLRAQYAGGLSPWTALLSGNDPQAIGRELSYLGYVTDAQANAVRAVRQVIDKLAVLQSRAQEGHQELAAVQEKTVSEKQALETQKAERQKVLARIEATLVAQRGQAERLTQNDKRLGSLIGDLDVEIARQAEEARLRAEEARRKAEQARREEEARRAAEAQRLADIERAREQAREAELAARAAQVRAQREKAQKEAEQARQQVEQARARQREAEAQARTARREAQERERKVAEQAPTKIRGTIAGTGAGSSQRLAPQGGFQGLPKNLPYPVQGQVQGRFGAERPEGGLWRGIVLRTAEGTSVHAIAAGRVVYANWLSGFGNIMIVDHGAGYLSVYGYNQSLLKKVGDIVAAGDNIATVGATGGQVEPGLYLEIRHKGIPVNPLLWITR